MRCFASSLAAWLACMAPAAAEPFATFDLVWVRPAAEPGAPPPCARMLVLDLPRDWMPGDAAAIVIAARADAAAAFPPLVAALLAERTAVLEFPSGAAEGCGTAPPPVAEVLGAAAELKRVVGAGLVVAVGAGAAGAAALEAAREEVAARFLGAGGPRIAVAVAIGPDGGRTFAPGAPPLPEEAWGERFPLLCAALAGPEGPADCIAALNNPRRPDLRAARRGAP